MLWHKVQGAGGVGVGGIVTDGLVLYLDAANPLSYSGSGTTWSDLSNTGNDGTLLNGVSYSSSDGGSLVFDGSNDYVSSFSSQISGSGSKTINIWFKSLTTTRQGLCGTRPSTAGQSGWALTHNANAPGVITYYHTGVGGIISGAVISTNVWYCLALTYDVSSGVASLYLNGNQTVSPTSIGPITSSSFNGVIGAEYPAPTYPLNGNISQVTIYNRVLSSSEIQQNYNSIKTRFGY